MRKVLCGIIISSTIALSFAGCKKNIIENQPNTNLTFESDVKIQSNNEVYDCEITHNDQETCIVKFKNPETLKNFNITCENGNYSVSMKELKGEFSLEPLCEKSGLATMIKLFDAMKNTENLTFVSNQEGERIYRGKLDSTDFEITLDKNGNILHINLPHENFRADFKYSDG